jgi:hypothetical protein
MASISPPCIRQVKFTGIRAGSFPTQANVWLTEPGSASSQFERSEGVADRQPSTGASDCEHNFDLGQH